MGYSLIKVGRKSLTEKMTNSDLREMNSGLGRYLGEIVSGRGNSKCKGPAAGMCPVCSRNSKDALWLWSATSQRAHALVRWAATGVFIRQEEHDVTFD